VRALSTLVDADGRLSIDGLAAITPPPAPEDLALVEEAARHHDLEAYCTEVGAVRTRQKSPREALHETMFACTLNIDALVAGKLEDGKEPATVIPKTARAFADLRLLPGMKAEEVLALLRAHLDRRGLGHVEVICRSSYPASRASVNEPVAKALIAAMSAQSRNLRVFPIHAGAAPMYVFSETLGIPYVFGGVGHGAGSHGPNEYILIDDVAPFMKSVASFFYRFAETWARARA
jgi:acetylornithine deacetylase/succinyl-diaminopimelate desuccinylase-like protein